MVYALTKTKFYSESRHPMLLLLCFGGWIYLTKLVKLIPYFWRYPTDFFLFFFPIPAYPLFAYCHSILKLWAGITFWNHSWTGRNLSISREKPFPSPAKQQTKQTLDEKWRLVIRVGMVERIYRFLSIFPPKRVGTRRNIGSWLAETQYRCWQN